MWSRIKKAFSGGAEGNHSAGSHSCCSSTTKKEKSTEVKPSSAKNVAKVGSSTNSKNKKHSCCG
jgi:hypothetical protein